MKVVCFIILFFSTLITFGQESATSQSHSYLKSYLYSGLTIIEQPLHYDWKDWSVFAGVATATTLAFIYDDEIYDYVNASFTDSQSNTISRYTDVFGEEWFIVPSVALTYAVGAIDKNPRLKNLSLATLQSFIFAEVASAGIKGLTWRARPQIQSPNSVSESRSNEWQGPFATFENTSFVSGHAMRSFAVAATVAGLYPEKPWLGVISYSLATMTSLGRIIAKEHWTSDVIVGAAIGYFIGKGVVKFNQKLDKSSKIDVEVVATQYGMGFALKF